jgi:beta-glucosidase-like glycosyl hydrolase
MWGLRWSYLFSYGQLYIDLVKAGNDIIIDFSKPFWVKRRIAKLKKAVEKGEIQEKRIDQSVERILIAKGYKVII